MTQRDLLSLESCVCFNLRRAARVVTQHFDAEVRRHGIRPTQTPILGALRDRKSLTMSELSDWLGMERTTLIRNLRPLQREGFVRATSSEGRGRVALSITNKGRKALESLLPAWRTAQNGVVATLGEERWSAILADLERASRALTRN